MYVLFYILNQQGTDVRKAWLLGISIINANLKKYRIFHFDMDAGIFIALLNAKAEGKY